jgi:hypothetical protein
MSSRRTDTPKSAPARGRGRPAADLAPTTVGYRLRAMRLRLSAEQGAAITQADFADRVAAHLGTSFHQTRLSRLESNEAEPTLAELLACAHMGDVSVAWLAYGFETSNDLPESRGEWLAHFRDNTRLRCGKGPSDKQ